MAININNALNNNVNSNNTTETLTQKSVNYLFFARGFLADDAKIYHAQCTNPNCKRWVNLYETRSCPVCGGGLDYIRAGKDNTPMCVGEITFFLAIGRDNEDRYKNGVIKKGKSLPVHRVKMYSFADENGNLPDPHPDFHNLKKGTMIEVKCYNHPPEYTPFTAKDGTPKVEVMVHLFDGYGDELSILRGAKKAEATTAYNVTPNGDPAPVNTQTQGTPAPAPNAASNVDVNALIMRAFQGDAQAFAELQKIAGQTPAAPSAPNPPANEVSVPDTMTVEGGTVPFPDVE